MDNPHPERPTIQARVISDPQIGFPFPGEAEINVICEILEKEDTTDRYIAVVIQGNNLIPGKGTVLKVKRYENFYPGRPVPTFYGEHGVTRYCL